MSGLPQGWELAQIGDLCDLVNGKAFKPSDWTEEGLPIVRIQNLNKPDASFNHFDGEVADKFRIEDGQLLFAWSGTPGTSFGAHVWKGGSAVLNQHIFKVVFDEGNLDKYFFKTAINQKLDELIGKAHGGVGLRHVTKGKFEETEISVPPAAEQKRIVAKLDSLSARSDRARAELDAIPRLIARYKQAILAAAFRGDLTADWRANAVEFEVLSELIPSIRRSTWEASELQKATAKGKPKRGEDWKSKYRDGEAVDVRDEIGLPTGWQLMTIDAVSEFVTDGEHQTPKRSDTGVPLLSARNIQNGHLDLSKIDYVPESEFQRISRRVLSRSGDVLLSCSGSVGRTCVMPSDYRCTFVRSVAIIRPLLELGDWLSLCLRSDVLQDQIRGRQKQTGQPNIFQGAIKKLAVPIAPKAERKLIVERIETAFAAIDRLAAEQASASTFLDRLDQCVLAKAFRGEMVPQDRNDEPASVLLERIRAERAAAPKPKRANRKKKG